MTLVQFVSVEQVRTMGYEDGFQYALQSSSPDQPDGGWLYWLENRLQRSNQSLYELWAESSNCNKSGRIRRVHEADSTMVQKRLAYNEGACQGAKDALFFG